MEIVVVGTASPRRATVPAAGVVVVGRGAQPTAGEVVLDVSGEPEAEYVSRRHLRVRLSAGVLLVTDTSSNGTFSGAERLPSGVDVPWDGEPLRLAGSSLTIQAAPAARPDSGNVSQHTPDQQSPAASQPARALLTAFVTAYGELLAGTP